MKWTERHGDGINATDSLTAAREWVEREGAAALDVPEVDRHLGPALVGAGVAGRYDVEATPVDLHASVARAHETGVAHAASAAAKHARLPLHEHVWVCKLAGFLARLAVVAPCVSLRLA